MKTIWTMNYAHINGLDVEPFKHLVNQEVIRDYSELISKDENPCFFIKEYI